MVPEFSLPIQSPGVSYERTVTANSGSTCINRTAANEDGWLSDGRHRVAVGPRRTSSLTMPLHSNSFGNEGIGAWLVVRSSLPYDFIIGGGLGIMAPGTVKSTERSG